MRRVSTSLVAGDELLVAQYNGPRLPQGATSLPEGAKLRWILVKIHATPPVRKAIDPAMMDVARLRDDRRD